MLRSRDMQFVMSQSQSAAGSAVLGALASQKSSNPDVQSFARLITTEYTKMDTTLAKLVAPRAMTLPDEIPADELSVRYKFQNLPDARFDRTYLKATVKETERTIKSFKTEIKKGRDSTIQKFAVETLPVLQDHLEKASSLYRIVAGKPAGPSGAEKKP
jgi:putative membrane protein